MKLLRPCLIAARWLALAGAAFLASGPARAAANRPPNVVVFLADDAGWGDYGIHGNQFGRTPNIDTEELAAMQLAAVDAAGAAEMPEAGNASAAD